ncbi:hypothetical protein [Muricoccus radiodurans]|uniref:hypothetical protein n=1 Tax=Muricoccus radiodurans TaxID=2231721 RepID=UPI003CF5640B
MDQAIDQILTEAPLEQRAERLRQLREELEKVLGRVEDGPVVGGINLRAHLGATFRARLSGR